MNHVPIWKWRDLMPYGTVMAKISLSICAVWSWHSFYQCFFFLFGIWVLWPFQEYCTYIEPIVHQTLKGGRKQENPGENPPDHLYAELGFLTWDLSEARTTAARKLMDYESTLSYPLGYGGRLLSVYSTVKAPDKLYPDDYFYFSMKTCCENTLEVPW